MVTARNVIAGIVLGLSASGFAQSPSTAPAVGSATAKEAPAGETAAKKTFNESRSNTTRAAGTAATGVPAGDAAAKKTFNESRSNTTRATGGAKAAESAADAAERKSFFESRSNTVKPAPDGAKAGTGQAAAAVPGGSVLQNAAPPAGTAASSAPK